MSNLFYDPVKRDHDPYPPHRRSRSSLVGCYLISQVIKMGLGGQFFEIMQAPSVHKLKNKHFWHASPFLPQ
jgi:hypothetical protein